MPSANTPAEPDTAPRPVASIAPASLQNGDRLTSEEFLRRYRAMPKVHHAQLVEGRVYIPSPVSAENHGEPHGDLVTWLGVYRAGTPGVIVGDNSTVELDVDNVPQPDAYLRLLPERGGRCVLVKGYLQGPPELIVEIAASSASYDLHEKRNAYRRNGVREYIVWRVLDQELDWFRLQAGEYVLARPDADGVYRSTVFPGLWLDPQAILSGHMSKVLEVLAAGLASPEHQAFVASAAPST